jgi:hypothetical protein
MSCIYGIITMKVHTVHLQNYAHEYRTIKLQCNCGRSNVT